jgi:hypothetical protein
MCVLFAACGADSAGPPDAAGMPDGGFQPAAHAPLPQIPDHGGPVLEQLQLVTVTFAGYRYQDEVAAFGDWIVGSRWLATICAEYRCATGAHVAQIVLAEAAPAVATQADIEAFLRSRMQAGAIPRPPSHDNGWLYVIFYPESTRVDAPGFTGCQTGGYHYFVDDGQARSAYSPIPDCSASRPPSWTALGSIEENASHELIEAVTNPYASEPAFYLDDRASPWSIFYGEVADYCVGGITEEGDFTATRVWSNRAAASGLDPCQPALPAPYYNVTAPAMVQVPSGGSAMFSVTGWSTAARAPWSLSAIRGWQGDFDPMPRVSGLALQNGDSLTVTVSSPPGSASGTRGSVAFYSFDDRDGPYAMWPVLLEVR